MLTEGEGGGVGDASFSAGDTCGGVEETSEELRGAASSESPEGGNSHLKKYPVPVCMSGATLSFGAG